MTADRKGEEIYSLCKQLFPICRSLSGDGNRKSLKIIQDHIPIKLCEINSGEKIFDWIVPPEWNIDDGYVLDQEGNKIIDFKKNNLHVMGYSKPVDKFVDRETLEKHLYSIPDKTEAIPYVTSYYKKRWGFCISQNKRDKIKGDKFRVVINSKFKEEGSLSYAELLIPGKSQREVFLSSYICHPSMANNECSGPAVLTYIAKYILGLKNRKYSYRIVLAPESIGPIIYLSKNIDMLKKNTIAAFNFTCLGDNLTYSFLPSRKGNTLTDRVALNVLNSEVANYDFYPFTEKGSDERQYCHPAVDLPMVSIMRSKYGTYPEYHTSLDNLDFISPEGLQGSYNLFKKCINVIEHNNFYKYAFPCEPMLMKRNLVPKNWHKRRAGKENKKSMNFLKNMMNIICYCDGEHDLIDISNILKVDFETCDEIIKILLKEKIILRV
tara:strand:- start:2222 stop:3532 length:1311 start_codon:yes stop_codon:yes gene_type:complete